MKVKQKRGDPWSVDEMGVLGMGVIYWNYEGTGKC